MEKILQVIEYRNVIEVNEHLSRCKNNHEIIVLSRTFDNPTTKLLTSTLSYIIIEYADQ